MENHGTKNEAVGIDGIVSNKVWVSVASILVLDTDLARSCEDLRYRGPRELLKGCGVYHPASWMRMGMKPVYVLKVLFSVLQRAFFTKEV